VASSSFYFHRGKAAALALILAVFTVGCGAVTFLADATLSERFAGVATAALFGWGLVLATARLFDRRAALVIDSRGVRDRRMKIDAPWDSILGARIWVQEMDAAKATWIALDVDSIEAVRSLSPLWARLRRATLERWGRPPVALNLQGLTADAEDVFGALARFRPDLAGPNVRSPT
jgi:hypothetical protein